MNRSPFFLLLGAAALSWCVPLHSAAPADAQNLPAGTFHLQRAKIIDAQGFGRPMTAVTLFIPNGWTAQGGVIWQTNQFGCGRNATRFEWTATAPDGVSSVQILPEETWSGHNLPLPGMQGTCPNITITNAKDFLHWYVQRERGGARVLEYRERPEFAQTLAQLEKNETTAFRELRSWAEGGEVLIAYKLNGHDMRETLAMTVMFFLNRMNGVHPGEIREFLTVSTLPGFAMRAPHGSLDSRLTETMRRTMKADPEWSAAMAEHTRKMTQIYAQGAANRHAIRMDTIRQMSEIQQQGYENQQATIDRIHQRTIQMIRGVQIYFDPSTNEHIEVPHTGGNVWRLNDGSLVVTDNASFHPGRDLGVDGRQLEISE
jgi:hypothetical protein